MEIGEKHGKIIALYPVERTKKSYYWMFKCNCGKEKKLNSYSVKAGYTKSCGCLNKLENHYNWKGDSAGYDAMHGWMERKMGKPKYCEHCKRTDKKRYEWANKDHKYRRVLTDYMRLCTYCHHRYDRENNGYKH